MSHFVYSIQNLSAEERPRERLMRFGAEALSSSELIAIILGSGTREKPVLHLAQEIAGHFKSLDHLSEATIQELCQIKGVGKAKALQLKAALNLGMRARREAVGPKYRIKNPSNAYHFVKEELEKESRELFIVILLDVKCCVIAQQTVAIGTLTDASIHPREVFYPAIRHKASALILVHNHPSGDPTPSEDDFQLTKSLIESGKLIDIPVNDHIIIGNQSFVSIRQKQIKGYWDEEEEEEPVR